MKTAVILVFLFCLSCDSPHANPFGCKIPPQKPVSKPQVVIDLELKGIALINNKRIAIIEIGESSFEVNPGDSVMEYHITGITNIGISYTINNKQVFLPLHLP